jgi:uncharacterized membrane protein YbhN (UPF0104 family)
MLKTIPSWFKLLLKTAVTACCLWYVGKKINWVASLQLIQHSNLAWLALATLLFAASKIISSVRLNIYFKNINVYLPQATNLRLYWLGMFYNLFLPGGIGGDAYKVILLNKTCGYPAKQLTAAVLLDRLTGVIALGLLAAVYFAALSPQGLALLLLAAIVPALIICRYFVKKVFPSFIASFWPTLWLGIAVQGLQVMSVYAIMQAIGISGQQTAYIFIFLLSSIVAILPLTIGGLGAREVVFLWGSKVLLHNPGNATPVSISISFYLITLLVSLAGVYYVFSNPLKKNPAAAAL